MATIVPVTTYPAGALSISGHNANVYAAVAGRGILSEPNGGLTGANLDPTFTLRDEHVMPEEGTIVRMDGTSIPMDVYNDAFGIRDDDDPAYVALAGLGERIYLPYNVSCLLWQWSFSVSVWRPYLYQLLTRDAEIPPLALRVFIDGVEQAAFRRYLPVSADLLIDRFAATGVSTLAGSASAEYNYEQITQLWFDISKLQTSVAKGFHELTVKLYLPRITFNPTGTIDDPEELSVVANGADFNPFNPNALDEDLSVTIHQRVSFGTRNVRCIAFK